MAQVRNRLSGQVIACAEHIAMAGLITACARDDTSLMCADLSCSDLSCIDFSRTSLNMSMASLDRADISYCDMRSVDLTGSTLNGLEMLQTTGNGRQIKNAITNGTFMVAYTRSGIQIDAHRWGHLDFTEINNDIISSIADDDLQDWWRKSRDTIFGCVNNNPAER